jgi:nicotinamide-nucleotide amidase
MLAEIIAIGDELTTGQRLDTNSQWLSQRLTELGIEVAFHTTVGDDLDDNVAVFRVAIDRADFVVATGGLGPTADDLTREAMATAAGVDLVQDDAALAHIHALFARRARSMPKSNLRQAQFPRGSRVIPNPHGTAPGVDMTIERPSRPPCRLFALPGVPAEMFAMWEGTVAPAIAAAQPIHRITRHRRIKCFGTGESHLEAMLPDMIRRGREPLVGITVSDATITLRITASGPTDDACQAAMQPTVDEIYKHLGVLVFGEADDELQDAVARLLTDRKQTVAIVEGATDGLVTHWLADAAQGAASLRCGIDIPAPSALQSLLGIVPQDNDAEDTLTKSMATAIRQRTGADYGLAISGLPASASDQRRNRSELDGTLHIALATADNVRVKEFPLAGHPAIIRPRAAKQALNMLRLALLNSRE